MENTIKRAARPVLITWIISVLCYLPLIAKGLTNSIDGLWAQSYFQAGDMELSAGRWAWLFLDKSRGGYGAEPFNSLAALLLISIAIYTATGMFMEHGEKPRYKYFIISMMVLCSTTVTCYLSYRFQSPTFGMSVLLSVGASWLIVSETNNKKKSYLYFAIATIFLVMSLGLYQANLGCFCVIIILSMMKLAFQNDTKKILKLFLRALLCGIVSCVLYKIAWDICLRARHISASNYNGADSLSISHMILSLPYSIQRIYSAWISYFRFSNSNYVFSPIRVALTVLVFVLVIFIGIKKLHKTPFNLAIYLLLFLLLPIGANICIILAPDAVGVLTQMTFPMMMVLPLLLCFLSEDIIKKDWLLCLCGVLLLYGNIYAVGTDIDAMAQGSNSSNAIMNNIVITLNEKELLSDDYKYAFYGNISENSLFKKNKLYDMASQYAKFGTLQTKPDMVHKSYIGLADDIGVNLEIVDNNQYLEIYDSDVLENMPAFPSKDSIIVKDGIVIVKVSDDY